MQDRYAEFYTPVEPPGWTRDRSAVWSEISSLTLHDFLINNILTLCSLYQCEIEGYYNPKEKTVCLNLRGFLDAHTLLAEYDKFTEKQDCKDFLSVWAHMKDKYARALLVLFHISHIMVLTHPTHTFDYSYVHLFRAMDIVRLASCLSTCLSIKLNIWFILRKYIEIKFRN